MNKKTLFLAVDDPLLRVGLRVELEAVGGFKVVGEAINGNQAIADIVSLQPAVAVIDSGLPEVTIDVLVNCLHQRTPRVKILLLTAFCENGIISGLLKPGVDSLLMKSTEQYVILKVIRAMLNGQQNSHITEAISTVYPY